MKARYVHNIQNLNWQITWVFLPALILFSQTSTSLAPARLVPSHHLPRKGGSSSSSSRSSWWPRWSTSTMSSSLSLSQWPRWCTSTSWSSRAWSLLSSLRKTGIGATWSWRRGESFHWEISEWQATWIIIWPLYIMHKYLLKTLETRSSWLNSALWGAEAVYRTSMVGTESVWGGTTW